MKMFTREEVVEKIKEFNGYMNQEKELQEELLGLKISGSQDATIVAAKRHDEIIKEIDELRMNKMMPIISELAEFVAYCEKREKAELEAKQKSGE